MVVLRTIAFAFGAGFVFSPTFAGEPLPKISVMKSASCGCCNAWIEHLEDHGFEVEAKNLSSGALNKFKTDNGIAPQHRSCHTGVVDGYVIEGHVPASDIVKLLDTRPEARGLSVPRMPIGSPGMEMGDERDAYDVLLIGKDGDDEVFSSYEEN